MPLLAAASRPALRDVLDKTKRFFSSPEVTTAWTEYQAALLTGPGAEAGGKRRPRVYVLVSEIGPNAETVVTALRKLAQALG